MFLFLVLSIFFMPACATPKNVWVNPNVTQAQADADVYRCQQDAAIFANSVTGTMASPAMQSNQNIFMKTLLGEKEVNYQLRFKQCMELAGYHLEQQK